ncbi:chorismate mutase [Emcibacter sp.]|uniref:chorismate mutase n=1 Tax=Emcibacter sp. TaxID=1979954 RepID=UPI002AA6DAD2|nr:chorismate mutase [Emcibacter sp.]
MTEVRTEVDRIDRRLVPLLLERLDYIKQAGHIKQDRGQVHDDARIEDVVMKARAVAADLDGNESYIEDIYRFLINWSIDHEFGVWDRVHSES